MFHLPARYSVPAILPVMKTDIRPANGRRAVNQFSEIALMNMFLQQGQGSHTAMPGDFIIRNDRDVYQRESAAVECSGQNRVVKLIQPAGGVRIRAAFTGIEKDRYHQWQLLMASFRCRCMAATA